MKVPKPEKTINHLFEAFLADQEARLSPQTFDKYETVIRLYRSYLESYWPDHSGKDYEAVTKAKGTYCGTFGAKELTFGFSGFLGYFMPHKVIGGSGTMKAAGTVVKKLAKWLVEKGHAEHDESVRALVGTAARDLPASQKLLDRLEEWLDSNAPEDYKKKVEGHFSIDRVEPGRVWLEPIRSRKGAIGPIPVPEWVSWACKVGWDVGGVVGETAQGWRLVEVWNISP